MKGSHTPRMLLRFSARMDLICGQLVVALGRRMGSAKLRGTGFFSIEPLLRVSRDALLL
jgi:hypothetical protein